MHLCCKNLDLHLNNEGKTQGWLKQKMVCKTIKMHYFLKWPKKLRPQLFWCKSNGEMVFTCCYGPMAKLQRINFMAQTREIEKRRETRRTAVCPECLPRNSLIGPAHKASWHMRPPKGHCCYAKLCYVCPFKLPVFQQVLDRNLAKSLKNHKRQKIRQSLFTIIEGVQISIQFDEFSINISKFQFCELLKKIPTKTCWDILYC